MRNRVIVLIVISLCLSLSINGQSPSADPLNLVNSPYDEQSPVISSDGKLLFLTVANHPTNVGGKKDMGDIWISIWLGDRWSAPVHGGNEINNKNYNAVAGISADGIRLYLWGHYKPGGDVLTQGISVSKRTQEGWSFPENISIAYFLNRSSLISGSINSDENVLVFSAESYATRGAEDIYVSLKNGSGWGEPINLGSKINTPFQEFSPSLSEDGRRLFFTTNGGKGLGSFDIFSSDRLDDSWTSWSEPKNLSFLNTESRELFYKHFDAQHLALYTSTHNSDRYGVLKVQYDSVKIETPIRIEVKKDSVVSSNSIIISGRVTDLKTGEPLVAKLNFRSTQSNLSTSNKDGFFKIELPAHMDYAVEIDSKGYVNALEKIDIHTFEMTSLEMNFKLQPIEIGATISLKSVLFETASTTLLQESYDELNVVVDFLKSNSKVEIELEGHTDNRGDATKNLELSQMRVMKIKNYLVSRGINSRRIKGKGYGGTRPIATNDSEEARKLNRRVEFVILKTN